MAIRDTRLMARAIEQRWPVPNEMRAGMIRQLMSIIASKDASPREKTSAFKAILAAEKQNQEDEHKLIDVRIQQRNIELDAIAADLGIEVGFIEDATRQAGGGDPGVEDAEYS
jgi:hypothetical protein